jgi:hypothetical protein
LQIIHITCRDTPVFGGASHLTSFAEALPLSHATNDQREPRRSPTERKESKMSHFLAEYDSAAEAFADGLVVLDRDVDWLFNSDSIYAVTSMAWPLDTRVVHFAMIAGVPTEVVKL